ncbi:MAG: SRPBCC family protein [Mycobacterium sp.]
MHAPLVVEQSRAIPVRPADAFDGTAPISLPMLFRRRYGPIPPITAVVDQTGGWDTVGQSRTVLLAGGGSMREQLTAFDPPNGFGYSLTDITGPLSPLVSAIDGEWVFEPAGTGTKVTWRWTIHPKSGLTRPALPVFGRLWRGYARQALEELSHQLVA